MRRPNLKEASTEELIQMFFQYALELHHIMEQIYIDGPAPRTRASNRLITRTHPMRYELFTRGPDAARKLLPLLNHPTSWVRLQTAVQIAGYFEIEARDTLEQLVAESHQYDFIKGHAGMTLSSWDRGDGKRMIHPPPRTHRSAPAEGNVKSR